MNTVPQLVVSQKCNLFLVTRTQEPEEEVELGNSAFQAVVFRNSQQLCLTVHGLHCVGTGKVLVLL